MRKRGSKTVEGERDERVFEGIFHGHSATDKEFEIASYWAFLRSHISPTAVSNSACLGLEPSLRALVISQISCVLSTLV